MTMDVKADRFYEVAHPATNGHFVGHPIIPGVVIMADVMRAIREHFTSLTLTPYSAYSLRTAKFLRPVLPGHAMTITLKFAAKDIEKNRQAVSFECLVAELVVAKGALDFHG